MHTYAMTEKKIFKCSIPANSLVPVFLIFFNRPDTFKKVFDAVRKARPSKLFLVCDGPREGNESDLKNSNKCKKIAENIDWSCQVFCNYSSENLGCGMRMTSGLNWAFEYVDRIIVLEDDCVPSQDFFRFCEELLEKYKNDDRICMINAMNKLGIYKNCPYDYFFSGGCCWGWATWKRVWDKMDYEMNFLDDYYSMRCVESCYPYYKDSIEIGLKKRKELQSGVKLSAWTYQMGISTARQGQLTIVPKSNMITNIGLTNESEHALNDIRKLCKASQAYFNAPYYPTNFPLKHPEFVVEDRMYYFEVEKIFKTTFYRKIEGYFRRFLFSSGQERIVMFKKAINKICSR